MLLAGAISIDLEPYAVENPEANTYQMESNTDSYGRPFQWSTHNKPGKSILLQDNDRSGGYLDGVERDAFGRPVEGED